MKKRVRLGIVVGVLVMLLLAGCSQFEENSKGSTIDEQQETLLYLTRHGKTVLNTLDRVQGWADTPLTSEGITVAENLGKGLNDEKVEFKEIYTSDLGRAKETAQVISEVMAVEKKEIIEDKRLREASYGMFEGDFNKNMMAAIVKENGFKSADELTNLGMDMWQLSADTLTKIDQLEMAESADTISQRMNESLLEIAEKAADNGGGNILVVGHGMSISLFLNELSDIDFSGHLANASVSKVLYKDGRLIVKSIGETSYIEKGESLP